MVEVQEFLHHLFLQSEAKTEKQRGLLHYEHHHSRNEYIYAKEGDGKLSLVWQSQDKPTSQSPFLKQCKKSEETIWKENLKSWSVKNGCQRQ